MSVKLSTRRFLAGMEVLAGLVYLDELRLGDAIFVILRKHLHETCLHILKSTNICVSI